MKLFKKYFGDVRAFLSACWDVSKKNVIYLDLNVVASEYRRPILCVFVHYDSNGVVHCGVEHYLRSLQQAGCDILFVTATESVLENDSLSRIKDFVMGVVVRRNVGYDFGSWKTGIDCYPDMGKHYSHILFANDSVYGPLVDLKPVIEKWVESDVDVWALTDSYERRDHLQSYFWGVNTRAINSGFFDYFWRRYFRYVSDRNIVIDRYELRIKAIAEGYGLKVEACFALSKMQDELEIHNIKRVNPMHDLAFALIKNYSFPFVKKELLNRNPKKLATVPELEIVISERVPELWKAIKEDRLG